MSLLLVPALVILSVLADPNEAFRLDLTRHELGKGANYDGAIHKWNATQTLEADPDPHINYMYTASIYVGTPPQSFTVRLETSSPFLWVPDATCGNEKCPAFCKDPTWCSYLCHDACCTKQQLSSGATWCEKGVKKFQSSQSRTYMTNGTCFNVAWYVQPVDGFLGIDTITMGDSLTIPAATFGQAKSAFFDEESQSNKIYDGFLGLGPPVKYLGELPTGFEPPLLTAQRTGLVKQAIYSLYLSPLGSTGQNAGRITYGSMDSANCAADVQWVGTDGGGAAAWDLYLKSVSIGATTVSARGQENNVFIANIDFTNRFAFQAPRPYLDPLAKAVGAVYDDRGGYDIDCNAQPSLPPLQFEFGNDAQAGQTFNVSAAELIVKAPFGGSGCKLNIAVGGFPAAPPLVLVGAPLMRTYCTIFDIQGKGRVGFAKPLAH